MKLNNYTNFINEAEESSIKKAIIDFFKSKGISDDAFKTGNGTLSLSLYGGMSSSNFLIKLAFYKNKTDLTSKDFFENYNKYYYIYHELVKIFTDVSYKTKPFSNKESSGIEFRIDAEDLKKSTNNELRSILGLTKFKL